MLLCNYLPVLEAAPSKTLTLFQTSNYVVKPSVLNLLHFRFVLWISEYRYGFWSPKRQFIFLIYAFPKLGIQEIFYKMWLCNYFPVLEAAPPKVPNLFHLRSEAVISQLFTFSLWFKKLRIHALLLESQAPIFFVM
jgi:hypothetical protein